MLGSQWLFGSCIVFLVRAASFPQDREVGVKAAAHSGAPSSSLASDKVPLLVFVAYLICPKSRNNGNVSLQVSFHPIFQRPKVYTLLHVVCFERLQKIGQPAECCIPPFLEGPGQQKKRPSVLTLHNWQEQQHAGSFSHLRNKTLPPGRHLLTNLMSTKR